MSGTDFFFGLQKKGTAPAATCQISTDWTKAEMAVYFAASIQGTRGVLSDVEITSAGTSPGSGDVADAQVCKIHLSQLGIEAAWESRSHC